MIRSKSIRRIFQDNEGATAVEYAVVLMLVLLVVISAVQFFGEMVNDSFVKSADKINHTLGN